ncbi:MAG: HD family hydrolase [Hyphomicrobiaceae bacterium]
MSGLDETPVRAWQRMLSGRRLDLLNPSPQDVAIEDIAHGLARVARWNGQTVGEHAFTVAQHALVVEQIATGLTPSLEQRWQLAALLHDAAEYVIGDLISPFKAAIGLDYKAFENRLLAAIHDRFALPYPLPQEITDDIKRCDRIAAYHEATRLAGFDKAEAELYFGPVVPLPASLAEALDALAPMTAHEAQASFLARFRLLAPAAPAQTGCR